MSTIEVGLPDGRTLEVAAGSTVLQVAEEIGAGLARAAVAGRIAGTLVDLRQPLHDACALEIVTSKDPDAGEVIRHSAEHVMADAVKRLFPDAQVDAGRTDHTEKFQYDFRVAVPFTPEDLVAIEAEMKKIVKEKADFERLVVTRAEAERLFEEQGERLKVERLRDIPDGQEITLFRHGGFVDLCRGPHVRNAKQIGAMKLTEAAGAYWKGDESNEMLQRIYGTAFATKEELKTHLERIEEAKQRDHRRIGQQLDLFHIDALSPGAPFWHPKGMVLYNGLVDFVKSLHPKYGLQEVMAPQLFRSELFKTSGHYYEFHDDMFWFQGDEDEELAVKAMNCPGHCHMFGLRKRSYRELPLRLAEFSRLHRNERSGTLTGLARVRAFGQDDGHIFCEPDQVEDEIHRFFEMMNEVYGALGLDGVSMSVSTRPESGFLGEPEEWDRAEKALQDAVRSAGYECGVKAGEAAFYAPKVECDFKDVLGRVWTLGTIQLDMAMPERFGLRYIGRDGEEHRPAMLHRAVLGSMERFIAIYTEHTAGDFPLWLAPVQVAILPIADRHHGYAAKVAGALGAAGIRISLDDRAEKLNYKIREAELQKVPIMCVIGDQEEEAGTVSPRVRRVGEHRAEALAVDAFVEDLTGRIARREA